LSDKDIAFLLRSVRSMTDTPEAWNEYLNLRRELTKKAIANRQAGLYFPEGSNTALSIDSGQPVATPAPGSATAPATGSTMTPTAAPAMPGGIDYSTYDRQPARVQSVPNSTLLRGRLVRDTRTGALGIDIGGQILRVGDETWKWVQSEQRKQRSSATPMATPPAALPAPTVPSGSLQNVRPGVIG
jgi:hypothetical protein